MAIFNNHSISECPFITTQNILSGKWNILILNNMKNGAIRFNELQRCLTGISQPTLTRQLRQLEEDGLIARKIYAEIPPKVEYELTEIGKEFHYVLEQIEIFGLKYIDFVKSKQ